jgi:hypothetical protein
MGFHPTADCDGKVSDSCCDDDLIGRLNNEMRGIERPQKWGLRRSGKRSRQEDKNDAETQSCSSANSLSHHQNCYFRTTLSATCIDRPLTPLHSVFKNSISSSFCVVFRDVP